VPEAEYHPIQTTHDAQPEGEQIREERKNDKSQCARRRGAIVPCCRGETFARTDGPACSSLDNVETFGTPGSDTCWKDSDQEKERDQNPMKSSICRDGIHSDLVKPMRPGAPRLA
jgi:hypothetical protein